MSSEPDHNHLVDETFEDPLPLGRFSLSQAVQQRNIDTVRFLLDRKLFPAESPEFRHDALHLVFEIESDEERAPFAKRFIETMMDEMEGVEEVANALANTGCQLVDVVRARDASLTSEFLDIEGDVSDASVRAVVDQLDRENALVLLQRDDGQRGYFLDRVLQSSDSRVAETFAGSLMDWSVVRADTVFEVARAFETREARLLGLLLGHEIDVRVRESLGVNVLANAFGNAKVDAAEMLKGRAFPVDMPSCGGIAALHLATRKGLAKNVEFLLSRGADANARDGDGRTPLFMTFRYFVHDATLRLETRIVRLLLQNEADLFVGEIGWQNLAREVIAHYNSYFIAKVLLAFAAIIEVGGGKIDKSVENLRGSNRDLPDYYGNCVRQLRELEGCEVRDGLTMFGILSRKAERLCALVNDDAEKAVKTILKERGKAINRLYRSTLTRKLKKIRDLTVSRDKAVKFLAQNVKAFGNNYYVLKEVVGYFSYADLLLFK